MKPFKKRKLNSVSIIYISPFDRVLYNSNYPSSNPISDFFKHGRERNYKYKFFLKSHNPFKRLWLDPLLKIKFDDL